MIGLSLGIVIVPRDLDHDLHLDLDRYPAERTMRCAVMSRDGVAVNQRWRRGSDLLIFDCGGETVRFVERRRLPPGTARAALLADCQALFVLECPAALAAELSRSGIEVVEGRGEIVAAILSYRARRGG